MEDSAGALGIITKGSVKSDIDEFLKAIKTTIKVVGVGGAGCNSISRMCEEGVEEAELIAVNTDAQHLLHTRAPRKILIGKNVTKGLGAGSIPEMGEEAARESSDELREALDGADMVFVTCGLGGGTGTGGAPIVSEIAQEAGALTVGVCTLPFKAEGRQREKNAMRGLASLRKGANTTIVVPNDKLLEIVPNLPINRAFRLADEILLKAVKGITELITRPGVINLDFADLRTVLLTGNVAMIGLGESEGADRAEEAINEAMDSPLLSVDTSSGSSALINVIGGNDMTLQEAEKVVEVVAGRISSDAKIIWGTSTDDSLRSKLRALIVITGVRSPQLLGPLPAEKGELGIDFI
jgi:cell division protein FtsZ